MYDRTHVWLNFALVVLAMLAPMGVVTARLETAATAAPEAPTYPFEALVEAGLKVDTRIDEGELGRIVRAGLVHTSRTHLVVNAVALLLTSLFWWRINVNLRQLRQSCVLPAIAIISSSAGFLGSYLIRAGPSGGASAGIYGILAAVAGATWALRGDLVKSVRLAAPIALTVLSLAAVLLVLGKPGMDHAAHLGGWAAGLGAGIAAQRAKGRVVLGVLASSLIVIGILL